MNEVDDRNDVGILKKILTDAQVRRFMRVQRLTQCQEIAAKLKGGHPFMDEQELDVQLTKLMRLLSQDLADARMAHFHGVDEDMAREVLAGGGVSHPAQAECPKAVKAEIGLLQRLASFFRKG